MAGNAVARRYAKALVSIVKSDGNFDEVAQNLRGMASLIEENLGFRNVLINPSINKRLKEEVLGRVMTRLGLLPLVSRFLTLLLEKDRLRDLSEISEMFATLSDRIMNRVKVDVKTAFDLTADEETELKEKFQDVTKKDVMLHVDVDRELIGGLIARVGSEVFDGSVRNRLETMKEVLLRG